MNTTEHLPLDNADTMDVGPSVDNPIHHMVNERLGNVAVAHRHFETEDARNTGYYIDAVTLSMHEPEDDGITFYQGAYVLDRASQAQLETTARSENSIEKQRVIISLRTAITMAAAANTDQSGIEGQLKIAWSEVANNLLELGKRAEHEPQRDNLLVSAVVASQFAEDDSDRVSFLRTVYQNGDNEAVADACARSPIVLVHQEDKWDETGQLYPLERVAHAFRADPKVVERYVDILDDDAKMKTATDQPQAGPPSAKAMQKRMIAEIEDTEVKAETQMLAQQASVRGESVGGSVRDPHKIERFALQQMFIKQQMKALLGAREQEGDLAKSPFALELVKMRGVTLNTLLQGELTNVATSNGNLVADLLKLELDVTVAMRNLSRPLIQSFETDRLPEEGYDGLTKNQMATVRFRAVQAEMAQHAAIGQYVNLESFIERRTDESASVLVEDLEVWTLSEDGAATPGMASVVISTVVEAAKAQSATPEEIWAVLQSNRRPVLAIATHHLEGNRLTNAVEEGSIKLERDDDGKLTLKTSWRPSSKDASDVYSAVALGCPALREIHESRSNLTAAEKLSHGSANYIDHILAAITNEAYERGLLDLARYDHIAETPPLPAPRPDFNAEFGGWPELSDQDL